MLPIVIDGRCLAEAQGERVKDESWTRNESLDVKISKNIPKGGKSAKLTQLAKSSITTVRIQFRILLKNSPIRFKTFAEKLRFLGHKFKQLISDWSTKEWSKSPNQERK